MLECPILVFCDLLGKQGMDQYTYIAPIQSGVDQGKVVACNVNPIHCTHIRADRQSRQGYMKWAVLDGSYVGLSEKEIEQRSNMRNLDLNPVLIMTLDYIPENQTIHLC